MDERRNNKGTAGNKGGRPSKAEEHKLIEKLTPMQADAFKALKKAIKENQSWAVKLYMEYFYGKPRDRKEHTFPEGIPEVDMSKWK